MDQFPAHFQVTVRATSMYLSLNQLQSPSVAMGTIPTITDTRVEVARVEAAWDDPWKSPNHS